MRRLRPTPGTVLLHQQVDTSVDVGGVVLELYIGEDGALIVDMMTEHEPYGESVLRVYVNDGRVFDGAAEPVIES